MTVALCRLRTEQISDYVTNLGTQWLATGLLLRHPVGRVSSPATSIATCDVRGEH